MLNAIESRIKQLRETINLLTSKQKIQHDVSVIADNAFMLVRLDQNKTNA